MRIQFFRALPPEMLPRDFVLHNLPVVSVTEAPMNHGIDQFSLEVACYDIKRQRGPLFRSHRLEEPSVNEYQGAFPEDGWIKFFSCPRNLVSRARGGWITSSCFTAWPPFGHGHKLSPRPVSNLRLPMLCKSRRAQMLPLELTTLPCNTDACSCSQLGTARDGATWRAALIVNVVSTPVGYSVIGG